MLTILLYISMITGGLLIFLLVISFVSGLDLDLDLDLGESDIDAGGLGVVKGILTFFSIGSFVVRSILMSDNSPILAFSVGILVGSIAVFILSKFMKFLLRQQSNVNWSLQDSLYQNAKVYLKIPASGEGIIHVNVNGVNREIKAKSSDSKEIPTGATVLVEGIEGNMVVVNRENI